MNVLTATNKFLKRNLATGDDFGVGNARQEAERVDSELGRIHSDTVNVGDELGKLDQNSALKPPTFADVSNKQLIMGTTAAGAVLGGTIGLLNGMASGAAGVQITETQVPIEADAINGAGIDFKTYEIGPDDQPDVINGWDVDFTRRPLIKEKVGELTERSPVATSATNIAVSGAIGLGIGAVAGAGVGVIGMGLRKVLKKDYNGSDPRQTEGDKNYLIGGAVGGAVIGAAAGAISNLAQSTSTTYETQTINYTTGVIGQLPVGNPELGGGAGNVYFPNRDGVRPPENADAIVELMDTKTSKLEDRGYGNAEQLRGEDITGQVPERNLIGQLKIRTEEKTTSAGPSMLGSIAGGAAIGAVTGIAGGVLVNVLRKTL